MALFISAGLALLIALVPFAPCSALPGVKTYTRNNSIDFAPEDFR